MLLTLLSPQTAPATSAILIGSSNNPSYRSGFYSPRRGGTPKYPSLWDGCVGAWAPSLGATGLTLRDESVYGNHGTLTDMDPANDWVVSGGKGALDFDGSNDRVESTSVSVGSLTSAVTVSVWMNLGATGRDAALFGLDGESTSRMQAHAPWNDNNIYWDFGGFTGTNRLTVTGLSWTVGKWYHLVFLVGNGVQVWRDGMLAGSSSNSPTRTVGSSLFFIGGSRLGAANYYHQGPIDDFRVYNRALTPSEIKLLASRRGIAFERASRKLSVSSAAAPTGSVSSTLANATLSSSGTLASGLTGTVSVTLADATLSATGTLTNAATGSLSSTLANASLSATGTLVAGASGSVTRTLDAATLSSSGTIGSGLTGSVSVSLSAATLSSSGTLTAGASGSVTRTLDNATLSSSGTLTAGASGTVSRTLDAATLLATGGAAGTVTGSVSATLAAVTCSATGTLAAGLSGTVVRTLADVTSSATGTLTNGASGTVTRTLANATLASGGSLSAGLTAQVNRALESCVVSSSGTLASGLTGTLSVQLASATLQSGNVAVGGLRIKVGGEWKNANAFVKVTGTWKNATPYVKVSGVWK